MYRFVLVPWKQHGHDRLYLNGPGGSSVGYQDRASGEVHATDATARALVAAAVASGTVVPVVVRWRKAGADRLYVHEGLGSAARLVGHADLVSGEVFPAAGESMAGLMFALSCHPAWVKRQSAVEAGVPAPRLAQAPAAAPAPGPAAAVPADRDGSGRATAVGSAGAKAQEITDRAAALRAQADRLERRAGAWAAGEAGERRVGAVLDGLAADGLGVVLHDRLLRAGSKANVDHVLVGRFGVVVVDAKNWSGQVTVGGGVLRKDGRTQDKALAYAHDVGNTVRRACPSVPVFEAVCLAGTARVDGPVAVEGTAVLNVDGLADWVRSLPVVLDDRAVRDAAVQVEAAFPAQGTDVLADRPRRRVSDLQQALETAQVPPSPAVAPVRTKRRLRDRVAALLVD